MALSDQATDVPGRALRLDPLQPGLVAAAAAAVAAVARRPSCSPTSSTAPTLGAGWDVVRREPGADRVGRRAAHPGGGRRPLCRGATTPRTSSCAIRRPAARGRRPRRSTSRRSPSTSRPASSSTATTTTTSSSAGSPTPPRVTRSSSSSTRTRGTPRQRRPRTRPRTSPADFPDDYWVQLRYDGTNVTGWYSTDGSELDPGRTRVAAAGERARSASSPSATRRRPRRRRRRSTRSASRGPAAPSGPSFDDEFDGSSLDAARWNASIRQNQNAAVSGGQLTITTEPGDIYIGRHDAAAEQLHPPGRLPRRRRLGDRDEDRLEGQRRVRPGWPDRLRGRQQLRQARPDRRCRPDADQPHRAAHGGQRHADRAGEPTRRSRTAQARSSTCA